MFFYNRILEWRNTSYKDGRVCVLPHEAWPAITSHCSLHCSPKNRVGMKWIPIIGQIQIILHFSHFKCNFSMEIKPVKRVHISMFWIVFNQKNMIISMFWTVFNQKKTWLFLRNAWIAVWTMVYKMQLDTKRDDFHHCHFGTAWTKVFCNGSSVTCQGRKRFSFKNCPP